ncbi:hypothetical protein P5704_027275 (plasmid) [Pseudomonas sp. FeN3W]|nr:hypothetical protein P5704_027275 [Pseudomonas sp. FeN3W]
MLKHLQLTKIEAEALEHRLQFLADASDEDIEDLFDGEGLRVDYLQDFARVTSRNLREGIWMIPLSSEEAIAALVDAIEGATIHEMAQEAEQGGEISRQKASAYRRALATTAHKLSVLAGRRVESP